MAKLILHAGAGDDFEEAYRLYARIDRPAAERFEALVQQTLDRIVSDPSGGTSLDSMHRFYRAKPFPHLVIYR